MTRPKVLLIGYGNPGRLDDGLGAALARAIERQDLPDVTVEVDYQLTVEDADTVARHDVVLFADADTAGAEPFWVRRLQAEGAAMSFSTHSVRPEGVLALAEQLFGAKVDAYVIGIRGYEFNEFGERLSAGAQANLAEAVAYVGQALRCGEIHEVRSEPADGQAGGDPPAPARDERNIEDDPCKTEST